MCLALALAVFKGKMQGRTPRSMERSVPDCFAWPMAAL